MYIYIYKLLKYIYRYIGNKYIKDESVYYKNLVTFEKR